MPIVCINRPNRTKPRPFTASDVARIARNAVQDTDATAAEVLGAAAGGVGMGIFFCNVVELLLTFSGLIGVLIQIGAISGGLRALRALRKWLLRGIRIPIIRRVAAVLIALVSLVIELLKVLKKLKLKLSVFDEILVNLTVICEAAQAIERARVQKAAA